MEARASEISSRLKTAPEKKIEEEPNDLEDAEGKEACNEPDLAEKDDKAVGSFLASLLK